MEEITCIFCNTKNDNIYIQEDGYTGRKCYQCGLIYISPRPHCDEMSDLYTHDNAHLSARNHISSEFLKRLYATHNLNIMTRFIKSGSILEIGSGAGYFLDEAKKRGFEPYSIELNKAQAEFTKNCLGIPCQESPLHEESFGRKKFDIIYHCDVLSHFLDPFFEFATMHKKLQRGGLVIFETGNLGDVEKKYFKYMDSFQYPEHLFFFSKQNIMDLLKKTGFDLVAMYEYSIVPQLLFQKILKKIMGHYKNNDKKNHANYSQKSGQKKGIRNLYHYIVYFFRYKLGYIVLKHNRPQTLLIIAKKRENIK